MPERHQSDWERAAAGALVSATVVLVTVTLGLAGTTGYFRGAVDVIWVAGAFAFAVTGAVIVRAHRRHAIGWAFLWIGFFNAATDAATSYAMYGSARELPLAEVAAWIATLTWAPMIGLVVLVIAVFPTGRFVNRVFGTVAISALAATLVMMVVNAVVLWPLRSLLATNENLIDEVDNVAISLIEVLFPFVMLAAAISLGSLVVRFRRATGVERAQLKWLAVAALVMGPAILAGQALDQSHGLFVLTEVLGAPIWLALAVGVAVLRFRLYDIDRIISRTLSYGAVSAVLAAVYGLSVVALGTLARGVSGRSNDLVVALSTLLVAAAFQPVRRRVQELVDRRFNRASVDGLRAVEAFGRRLRDEVELRTVVEDLRDTVVRTVQPSHASVVPVPSTSDRSA